MTAKSTLIRDYAARSIAEDYGDGETPAAILTAIVEAQNSEEIEHPGRALLARYESLSDAAYRYGEENYDSTLKAIADTLGWVA